MYKCQKCKTQVEANVPLNKIVTTVRRVGYNFMQEGRNGRPEFLSSKAGTEIVQEMNMCPECADKASKIAPKVVGTRLLDIYR